ncbi:MAG: hypothetical protein AB7O37_23305 [Vicinamibacteria bacterium]
MRNEDRDSNGTREAAIDRRPRWTGTDYAEAVKQIADTITWDCAREIVLVVHDHDLYAFARLDNGCGDEPAVYVTSVDLADSWPQTISHELIAGRKPLAALREVIDRELACARRDAPNAADVRGGGA